MHPADRDILEGLGRWRSWLAIGYYDFIGSYRRTAVGVFWQPLQVSAWIAGLWLVFGHDRDGTSIAYIGIGVIIWQFLQIQITTAPTAFVRSRDLILNLPNPLSLAVLRVFTNDSFKWAMQLIVLAGIVLFSDHPVGPVTFLAVPGLLLLFWNTAWAALLLASIGARYKDLGFAVDAAMRLSFFLTPIFWTTDGSPERTLLALVNPFSSFVAVVRDPLLGVAPSTSALVVVGAFSLLGPLLTRSVYRRFQPQILFWV